MQKTLGERCIDVALKELGVRSANYGRPNTSPRVREYLAPCVRDVDHDGDQELLGLTEGNWCAAFASWCLHEALQPGEEAPHEYRAGVVELVADAKAKGLYHDVREVRDGTWTPRPGDLAIWDRSTKDPSSSWWRHVNRVTQCSPGKGTMRVIGGNESRSVRTSVRELIDPKLLGFVSYAQPEPVVQSAEERNADLALIAMFVEAHRRTL